MKKHSLLALCAALFVQTSHAWDQTDWNTVVDTTHNTSFEFGKEIDWSKDALLSVTFSITDVLTPDYWPGFLCLNALQNADFDDPKISVDAIYSSEPFDLVVTVGDYTPREMVHYSDITAADIMRSEMFYDASEGTVTFSFYLNDAFMWDYSYDLSLSRLVFYTSKLNDAGEELLNIIDVQVQATIIPEPAHFAAICGLLLCAAIVLRQRKRA